MLSAFLSTSGTKYNVRQLPDKNLCTFNIFALCVEFTDNFGVNGQE